MMMNQMNHITNQNEINVQNGWKCPICQAVMAPWQTHCVNCTGNIPPVITAKTEPFRDAIVKTTTDVWDVNTQTYLSQKLKEKHI